MQENFEHFNLEDLFKADLFDLQTFSVIQNQPSLTDEVCFSSNLKRKEIEVQLNTLVSPTYQPYYAGAHKHPDINMVTHRETQTKTQRDKEEDTSPSIQSLDAHDETFFDDIIKESFEDRTGKDLISCYGNGEMWKEEENAVWEEVSAMSEENGGLGGFFNGFQADDGLHSDSLKDGEFINIKGEEFQNIKDGMFLDGFENAEKETHTENQSVEDIAILNFYNSILNNNNNDNNIIDRNNDVISDDNNVNNNNIINIINNNNNSSIGKVEDSPYIWIGQVPQSSTASPPTLLPSPTSTHPFSNPLKMKKGIKRKIIIKRIESKQERYEDEEDEEDDEVSKREYLEKRHKNNQSVRKSRAKSRKRQEDVEERVGLLVEENDGLKRKVMEMEKEVEILKRLLTEVIKK